MMSKCWAIHRTGKINISALIASFFAPHYTPYLCVFASFELKLTLSRFHAWFPVKKPLLEIQSATQKQEITAFDLSTQQWHVVLSRRSLFISNNIFVRDCKQLNDETPQSNSGLKSPNGWFLSELLIRKSPYIKDQWQLSFLLSE